MNAPQSVSVASSNIRRLSQMELPGAGQVCIQGQ